MQTLPSAQAGMMDSCYSISVDGKSYFNNIRLAEFHAFQLGASSFMLHVGKLSPHRIPERIFKVLSKLDGPTGGGEWISANDFEALTSLDLIANLPSKNRLDSGPLRTAATPETQAVGSISLLVAQECNMRCLYCYGDDGEYGEKGRMSISVARKSVGWLLRHSQDLPSVHIGFFGGEPMLNFPVIEDIVAYAKTSASDLGKTVTFGLITNGVRLSEAQARFLRDNDVAVTISFDGPREIQNAQRPLVSGAGSYDRVRRNLTLLRRFFPGINARATVYGQSDVGAIRRGLDDAGFVNYQLIRVSNDADSDLEHADRVSRMLELENAFAGELYASIKARELDVKPAKGLVSHYLGWLVSPVRYHYYCGAGRGVFSVSATGDIYPCHRFVGNRHYRLGHLDSFQPGTPNGFEDRQVDSLRECSGCWARYACGGGCYHNNLIRRGNTHLRDSNFCDETRSAIQLAIALHAELEDDDKAYYLSSRLRTAQSFRDTASIVT